MPVSQRPLITFALFAYNQEHFVREAVEGALAQSYSPLEIVFSDDCSTDRTFEIIEGMTKEYEGPHKIVLNRNTRNLGLVMHVNRVAMKLASGSIIVVAAGDDVSMPDRVDCIWEQFAADTDIMSVSMNYRYIDSIGHVIGKKAVFRQGYFCLRDYFEEKKLPLYGCSRAYRTQIFGVFGPLGPWCGVEDSNLVFRSILLGKSFHIDRVGVNYRIGLSSMGRSIGLKTIRSTVKQRIIDTKKAIEYRLVGDDVLPKVRSVLREAVKKNVLMARCCDPDNSLLNSVLLVSIAKGVGLKDKCRLIKLAIFNRMNSKRKAYCTG